MSPNGFILMVFCPPTIAPNGFFQWFSMVANNWSKDGIAIALDTTITKSQLQLDSLNIMSDTCYKMCIMDSYPTKTSMFNWIHGTLGDKNTKRNIFHI